MEYDSDPVARVFEGGADESWEYNGVELRIGWEDENTLFVVRGDDTLDIIDIEMWAEVHEDPVEELREHLDDMA